MAHQEGPATFVAEDGMYPGRCPQCGTFRPLNDFSMLAPMIECQTCHSSAAPASFVEQARSEACLAKPFPGIELSGDQTDWTIRIPPAAGWRVSMLWLFPLVFTFRWMMEDQGSVGNERMWLLNLALAAVATMRTAFQTWGHYSLTVRNQEATLFRGIGSVGWNRNFNWAQLRRVVLRAKLAGRHTKQALEIEADRKVTFGKMLPDEQLVYLAILLVAKHRAAEAEISSSRTAGLQ